jgi:hypothetical protein
MQNPKEKEKAAFQTRELNNQIGAKASFSSGQGN